MKIRKGDKIRVTAGKDKGREGKVERVYAKQNAVVVPGINMYKKHVKKNEQMPQGGIVDVPRAIDVSKITLLCPKCGKPTRVSYEVQKNGNKKRVCKKCKSSF